MSSCRPRRTRPRSRRMSWMDSMPPSATAVRTAEQASPGATDTSTVYVCSSAGGGLRLAVVGYEPLVTAEAGHRVGLSAGARVVHVASGRLDRDGLSDLRGIAAGRRAARRRHRRWRRGGASAQRVAAGERAHPGAGRPRRERRGPRRGERRTGGAGRLRRTDRQCAAAYRRAEPASRLGRRYGRSSSAMSSAERGCREGLGSRRWCAARRPTSCSPPSSSWPTLGQVGISSSLTSAARPPTCTPC